MCQEIYINGTEVTRTGDCWCPLPFADSPHLPADQAKAAEDLGRRVVEILGSQTIGAEQRDITITVVMRRW